MGDVDLALRERNLTAVDIKAQVNIIQEVMGAVMVGPSKENPSGVHYGKIPGCGDKLTLLKPGAEKLMMTFRLAADPQIIEVPTDDGITYRIVCRITNQATGAYLGSGVGECSTKEEKYNWRKAVCDGEFSETSEDRRRNKWIKGYNNQADYQVKQVRTNPADLANTVLKMAKKRALVDAVLTVTAASDIFDQDLEEMDGAPNGDATSPKVKKTESVKSAPPANTGDPVISDAQVKLVYARLKAAGLTDLEFKTQFAVEHLKDIPAAKLNDVLAWIANPTTNSSKHS